MCVGVQVMVVSFKPLIPLSVTDHLTPPRTAMLVGSQLHCYMLVGSWQLTF